MGHFQLTPTHGRAGGPALWIAIFGLVAGWTLIETAVGSIHALLRRVERNLDHLPRRWRPASGRLTQGQKAVTAVGVLLAAAGLSTFGIIDLVARGVRHSGLGVYRTGGVAAVRRGAVAVDEGGQLVSLARGSAKPHRVCIAFRFASSPRRHEAAVVNEPGPLHPTPRPKTP